MKNVNVILNVILLAAVGYLFFDKFSSESSGSQEIALTEEVKDESIKIACLNMDSLNANYDFIIDQSVVIEEEAKKIQYNIQNRYKKAEQRNAEIQQSNPTSQAQYDALQKELYDLQTDLQNYEQAQSLKIQNIQADFQDQMKLALDSCLIPYKDEYTFIFSYGEGSELIHANDAYEISAMIIEELNANYQESLKDSIQ